MIIGVETTVRRRRIAVALLVAVLAAIALFIVFTGDNDAPTRTDAPAGSTETIVAQTVREPQRARRDRVGDEQVAVETPDADIPADRVMIVVTSGADGTPVASAMVVVQSVGVGLTNSRGIAIVDRPETSSTSVTVRASGFVLQTSDVQVPDGARAPISIVLQPSPTLELLIVDAETGKPVTSAAVALFRTDDTSISMIADAYSGATGATSVVGGFDAGDEVVLSVQHSDYAMQSTRITVPERSGEPMRVELVRGKSLIGSVLTHDGRPARAATVCVTPAEFAEFAEALEARTRVSLRANSRPWQQSRTRSDGGFSVPGLRADTSYVAVAVGSDGRVSERSPAFELDSLAGGVHLVLPPDGTLVIHVKTEDGSPLSDPRVEWMPSERRRARRAERVEDRYVVADLPPGPGEVRVTAPGHAAVTVAALVKAGASTESTVLLTRGHVLAGIVIDDRGAPVLGARVSARSDGVTASVPTDGDGRFQLVGLDAGDARVSVTANGHAGAVHDVVVPDAALTVRLSRYGVVMLRVRAPSTGPIPKTRLRSARYRGDGHPDPLSAGSEWKNRTQSVTFDGDVAELRIETVGPSRIVVLPKGFAPILRVATAEPGQTVDLGEALISRGLKLSGHVRDDAGRPVAGAKVEGTQALSTQKLKTETDGDGAFTIDRLMDAPVDLTVAKDGYSAALAELEGPMSDAAITLDLPVSIAVTLIDGSGRPVTGCVVACSPAFQPGVARIDPILRIRESRELREVADHPGRYEGQVAPGNWRVRVDGRFGDSSDIKVAPGEGTAHFEIHFE